MSELLPCPFCGGEYAQVRYMGGKWQEPSAFDSGYRGECCDCGVITAAYDTEAEAIAAWNTRAERTCRIVYRDDSFDTDAGFEYDGSYYCDECLCDLPDCVQEAWDDYQAGHYGKPIERCPNCGAKVVDA